MLSVLPGLRELRAPLAAGYLWLLTAWLIFGDDLPKRREVTSGALQRLYDLQPAVSAVGLAVVASVVAYIVGSIAIDIQSGYRRWIAFIWGWRPTRRARERRRGAAAARARVEHREEPVPVSDWPPISGEAYGALQAWTDRNVRYRGFPPGTGPAMWADYSLRRDRRLLMTRLLAESAALHTEVDRPDAEAAFRAGITPPFAVLVVYLAIDVSPLWLLGLLVPALLLWQSFRFRVQANDALVIAVLSRQELREPLLRELRQRAAEDRARSGLWSYPPLEGLDFSFRALRVDLDVNADDYAHSVLCEVEYTPPRDPPVEIFEVHLDGDFEVTNVIPRTDDLAGADEPRTSGPGRRQETVVAPSAGEGAPAP